MKKKSQIQIMQNAFIILFVTIIVIVAALAIFQIQSSKNQEKQFEFMQTENIKRVNYITSLPELACTEKNIIIHNCVDLIKIDGFLENVDKYRFYYLNLFGTTRITLKPINSYEEIVIFDNPKNDFSLVQKIESPIKIYDPISRTYDFAKLSVVLYN